uniref:GAB2 n=1 Tax=Mesocestoides corti TaxID=53468 RepID=A0A5K3F145_MESCO
RQSVEANLQRSVSLELLRNGFDLCNHKLSTTESDCKNTNKPEASTQKQTLNQIASGVDSFHQSAFSPTDILKCSTEEPQKPRSKYLAPPIRAVVHPTNRADHSLSNNRVFSMTSTPRITPAVPRDKWTNISQSRQFSGEQQRMPASGIPVSPSPCICCAAQAISPIQASPPNCHSNGAELPTLPRFEADDQERRENQPPSKCQVQRRKTCRCFTRQFE